MKIVGKTAKGPVRALNEDAYFIDEKKSILAVADGMGGHSGGAVASQLAVRIIAEYFAQFRSGEITEAEKSIQEVFQIINKKIKEQQNKDANLKEMGTTLTLGIFAGENLFIGHLGDSRAYVFRANKLLKLTQDHTYVAKMVSQGIITEEDAISHPYRHLLLKALDGANEEVDIVKFQVHPQDLYLFCTDGLLDGIKEAELAEFLDTNQTMALENLADELIRQALLKGSRDNITVVLARFAEEREVKK
ncbi:Stp1/IreP family PP2C-type Ser/Thr phosphatase [Carboxydothermus hydrogenoformans]|uniref:Putative serine/threonine protein phosphatase n=1 Tax=Carboxydothermus hydrogenoformans (strain ATCC BAA-161 / DSM 6008 / Z-2901) TaxID=246194 RepID=Q3AC23_CARHZ|nr:Stp1/IreP family PP2C-type Ser/Thr phosphatase [Carboxydothermus hydrogenoformans]ABB15498.1 putative serine/threonine protein phosphatase [Carboxydothermus hydrogenoformans Z-2901]